MVYKIIESRYRVFIESFLIAFMIFLIGFSIGFYIEMNRTSSIIDNYKNNEIVALDLKLQNYYYQVMDKQSCEEAVKQNFIFADKLYSEGLTLEKYEEANQISDELLIEKKRYVLLKTELWLNSLLLKEKCKSNFDIVVYFYSSDPSNTIKVAQQKVISNILKGIKEERGDSIVLIPLAGDLKLDIVDLQMRTYQVNTLPLILINEKILLEGFSSEEEVEKYLTNITYLGQ